MAEAEEDGKKSEDEVEGGEEQDGLEEELAGSE